MVGGGAMIFIIIAIISNIYHLLAALCAVVFVFRKRPDITGEGWPMAACLKPLCGHEVDLLRNMKSFLDQDYDPYELIFGTSHEKDPAYPVALSACKEAPRQNAKAVFGEMGMGNNPKVRNLMNIEAHVSSDAEIIVLSDSDIRVTRDYLKHTVEPLRNDPEVGAVTSIYRVKCHACLGGLIEALAVETTFVPGVLVAETLSRLRYAFGATIAYRRSDFQNAGGFQTIEDYIADDYQIGNIIFKSGKRIVLSPYVVSTIVPKQDIRKTFAHLVRWYRTIRISEPKGYLFSIIANCTLWASIAFVATGPGPIGGAVLLGTCILRFLTAAVVAFSIGSRTGMMRAILAPPWDLVSSLIWLAGLSGNKVTWRGAIYRIFSDGQMVKVQ
jgi:ceramide glucosyltransferase